MLTTMQAYFKIILIYFYKKLDLSLKYSYYVLIPKHKALNFKGEVMKNLVIKTNEKTIYVNNGKVTLVRDNKTGRFSKITPFIKVSAIRYARSLTKVVCNTSKFTNFTNTITLEKLLIAAANTLKPLLICGLSQNDFIKKMIAEFKTYSI